MRMIAENGAEAPLKNVALYRHAEKRVLCPLEQRKLKQPVFFANTQGMLHQETKLGLAGKFVLSRVSCDNLDTECSSRQKEGARAFGVNIPATHDIWGIGKGPTALNDFWATMNVSHHGLHH